MKRFIICAVLLCALASCCRKKNFCVEVTLYKNDNDTIIFMMNDSLFYNDTIPIDTFAHRILSLTLPVPKKDNLVRFYVKKGLADSAFYYNIQKIDTLLIYDAKIWEGPNTSDKFFIISMEEIRAVSHLE